MSIEIRIGIADDLVSADTLDRHMEALGFARRGGAQQIAGYGGPNVASNGLPDAPGAPGEQKTEAPAEAPKTTRSRKAKEEAKPAISTNPEYRKPPEDGPEVQEQDAADEQAEVEAAREPEKAITVDDLRGVMGEYVEKFEMPATQEDGPLIFADALGKPPAGEAAWKLSLLAEMPQERLKAAYAAWKSAVDSGKRYQKRG